jgi:MscS family membrane protein
MDKPFIQGDLIIVEGITGTVEYIGLRSTRIRTLEKSYVTVPNKVMVNAKLDNLTERTLRRVDFTIGVIYATRKEQIENIVTDITSYLNSLTFVDENPAVRFSEFGESSLNIRILFFLKSIDWQLYMDTRQDINFNIMEIVEKHGSDFAFPSRTVYLQQN